VTERALGFVVRLEPRLEAALRGRYWVPVAVLVALLLAVVFSTPGFGRGSAEFERRTRHNWVPAVQMKIDDPLHDMTRSFPSWYNQAKRTFRITAPAVAYLTRCGVTGAVVFEYLCLYATLHGAALLGFRLLGTRSAGFFAALLLASTYFGTAALKDAFYWFDSVSYGLLMLSMIASTPALRAMALFAAGFSDERALLVAPLTLLGSGGHARRPGLFRDEVLATVAAVGACLALRIALGLALGLVTPLTGVASAGVVVPHVYRLVACLWSPFEGAWLLIVPGVLLLLREPWPGRRAAAAAILYFGGYLVACVLVLDVTRSMSFAMVGLFPLLRAMSFRLEASKLRALLALAALVSLVVPNLFVRYELAWEVGPIARLFSGG